MQSADFETSSANPMTEVIAARDPWNECLLWVMPSPCGGNVR